MILLDTNVISELMRPEPHPAVLTWMAAQPRDLFYTASLVQSEILYGIACLPDGRRKASLLVAATAMFSEDFAHRLLPYDSKAAPHYAAIAASRRAAGLPTGAFDALIAATARANGAAVATRNEDDFAGCGVDVINPWSHAPLAGG